MAILGRNANKSERTADNAAKTLLANIRFMSVDKPICTVVITSSVPNEGKTFVAASLARAMATSGRSTIVVECDVRRRSMSRELEIHAKHGLYSVLAGERELNDVIVATKTEKLHFLDAEPHIPNPSDLLNSSRFKKLLEVLSKNYTYVVLDTPPIGTFVDAAVLGAQTDAVFMVVRERHTRRDEIARAAEQLKTANVRLSGVVMNGCESQNSEYYYNYYYNEDQPSKKGRRRNRPEEWQEGVVAQVGKGPNKLEGAQSGTSNSNKGKSQNNWSNAPDEDLLKSGGGSTSPEDTSVFLLNYAKYNEQKQAKSSDK